MTRMHNSNMNNLIKMGRFLFAVPIAVFGIQYLVYGQFAGGLPPVPPWTPGGPFWVYLTGASLISASLSIATKTKARLSSILLGILFFLCVLLLHGLRTAAILLDGETRTRAFEPLAMCGSAWVLAGTMPIDKPYFSKRDSATDVLAKLGRFLFAIPMVIFGLQHFMYAGFIADLVPSWIPGHLFCAYFTGVAFIAAGVSIVVKKHACLAATLLGIMFFLWALLLHAPRVAAQPLNGDEWTSAFVAVALGGGSFVVAGTMSKTGWTTNSEARL